MQTIDLTHSPDAAGMTGDLGLPTIPFEMAVLPNGLTLIVHENRRNPMVCTQLRFNVGSKDEPPGRTGFAHLFEHLMFKESLNRQGNWHRMLQSMGGTEVNGTTNLDRTNYFQTVPTGALDQLLWMESDRMGHLLGGIDAATLAEEVAVVKNEKRQREGAAYGGVFEAITTSLYPREHPYGHTVLGSFEDLDNATLETVADWHAGWYGASNAVLVLSGDINMAEALPKVEHWFGAMPAGKPARRATQWMPTIRDTRRITLFDRVPLRRVYSVWSTPNLTHPDSILINIAGQVLAGGVHSRLVQRLIERDRSCFTIEAAQIERYVCGEFQIVATLIPDADPAVVDAAITEEIDRLSSEGPTAQELNRIRSAGRRAMLGMLDNIMAVTDMLANNVIAYGRPDGNLPYLEMANRATLAEVRDAAARWLSGAKAVEVDVRPFQAVVQRHDVASRATPPALGEIQPGSFPHVHHAQLPNGLKIHFAAAPGVQNATFSLLMQGGASFDPEHVRGLSTFALATLDAGTAHRTKLEMSQFFAERGIIYTAGIQSEYATLTMSSLKDDIPDAMTVMSEILLDPLYPEDELRLVLDQQLAEAGGRGAAPSAAAGLALGKLIYGPEHDYGRLGSGTVEHISAITRDLAIARHQAWMDPANAILFIVGDFTLELALEMAEANFGRWRASGVTLQRAPSLWKPRTGRYFINRPGGPQSTLRLAMASPQVTLESAALPMFNMLFGGAFSSRLNANLRERRGWTYGAGSNFSIAPQIGMFGIGTDVQADRSMDAIAVIEEELRALTTVRPVTGEEMEEARHAMLVSLPMAWANNAPVLKGMMERVIYGLRDDYQDTFASRIRNVTLEDVQSVAEMVSDPSKYSWVVGGDPAHLDLTTFTMIDQDAKPL